MQTERLIERPDLTPRQQDVLRHLLDGLSEKEVAARLHISPHTVHNHVKALYRAFGVGRRIELYARCLDLPAPNAGRAQESTSHTAPTAQAILENAPDLILEIERNGIIRFINRPFQTHRLGEIIGTNIAVWIAAEELVAFRGALEAALATRRPQTCEHSLPSESGSDRRRRFQMRLSPLEEEGDVRCVIGVAREITERTDEARR